MLNRSNGSRQVWVLHILSGFMAVTLYVDKAEITICNMILLLIIVKGWFGWCCHVISAPTVPNSRFPEFSNLKALVETLSSNTVLISVVDH